MVPRSGRSWFALTLGLVLFGALLVGFPPTHAEFNTGPPVVSEAVVIEEALTLDMIDEQVLVVTEAELEKVLNGEVPTLHELFARRARLIEPRGAADALWVDSTPGQDPERGHPLRI